jgi:hypothetical protein
MLNSTIRYAMNAKLTMMNQMMSQNDMSTSPTGAQGRRTVAQDEDGLSGSSGASLKSGDSAQVQRRAIIIA